VGKGSKDFWLLGRASGSRLVSLSQGRGGDFADVQVGKLISRLKTVASDVVIDPGVQDDLVESGSLPAGREDPYPRGCTVPCLLLWLRTPIPAAAPAAGAPADPERNRGRVPAACRAGWAGSAAARGDGVLIVRPWETVRG